MSNFSMRNEIIFVDIQICQNIFFFTFLILHSYDQWRNYKGFCQGGKLDKKEPAGHCTGSISQHSGKT